ncbi:MAG: hypothetical protein ACM357_04020 [Gemmatimonadota bacterium]
MSADGAAARWRALAFLVFAACAPDRPEKPPTTPDAPAADVVWFGRERTLDFTGDGQADTVELRATGRDPDSLRVALTFRADGEVRWREEWSSEYELVDPPPLADSAARARYVRSRFERALASVEVEPFDRVSYVTMANPVDSTILRQPPAAQVSFAYGFETTVVLAWDPVKRVLRRLHACC